MKYLIFATVLCTALYFGKPEQPKYKKPREIRMLTKGYDFSPKMDTVIIKEHMNHSTCSGIVCPILKR